jgi:hypothetical protein
MMAGFIDVTGWTSKEVARLGHADDDTPDEFRPRRGARRPVQVTPGGGHPGFASADVWAAACAAQRINGEYLKEGRNTYGEQGEVLSTKMRNRDLMLEFLHNPDRLLPEDIAAGVECQNFLRNDLTFRGLKGQLNDFDQSTSKVLAVADRFFPQQHRYELAVVACLPQSHLRGAARQESQARMKRATGGAVGAVGNKVRMDVEVVSANYSQIYGIYWIDAVNDADQPVTFSYRSHLNPGVRLSIAGTVKGHRDGKTQLNRVKIV